MSFAFPQFLWALSALSIPVIIHLFNFRRTIKIYFSNTRLLKQVKEETTQKRKLKQYLVLASRLLFLLFLVFAFAQPFLPAKDQITSGKNIVVILDNSYSMTALVAEKTRALDQGINFVREIVQLFPPDTRYKFVTNDFAPFSNSFKTKTEIEDLLTQIRLSSVSRSFDEINKKISDVQRSDVFWISDFQKSTLGLVDSKPDSTNQWHLVPLSLGQSSNIFVDTVYLENPFVIGGEKNSIKLRLKNTGIRKSEGLIAKLSINGIQSATASVTLEPNGSADVNFDLSSGLYGLNEAKIDFNDYPVSFDNEFYFTLNFFNKISVVEIKNTTQPSFVQRVYGNNELFSFKSFQSGNVDYSVMALADLVIVNGLNRIDETLSAALASNSTHVAILLIPGAEPDLNSYKNILRRPLLTRNDDPQQMELDKPDFQNPFFENVFEERSSSLAMPRASRLLNWGDDRSAILKFKNGQPFLSQNGKVFLMACPLEKSFTDFYSHALFVPVMYRMAASGKRNEQQSYYTTNESLITLRADSLFGEEPLRLLGSQEIIPAQRRINDRVMMEIPRFAVTPGFYNVLYQRDTLDLLAFNLDKAESVLGQYTGSDVQQLIGGGSNISLFNTSSTDTFSNDIKERYLGTPLWKYAIVLALLFLLAEVLLIRFLK